MGTHLNGIVRLSLGFRLGLKVSICFSVVYTISTKTNMTNRDFRTGCMAGFALNLFVKTILLVFLTNINGDLIKS